MIDEDIVVERLLRANLFNGKQQGRFNVKLCSRTSDGTVVRVGLRFLKDETYCCSELTCHFNPQWAEFRSDAAKNGVRLATPLAIEFRVMVEVGANFTRYDAVGVPPHDEAYTYKYVFAEQQDANEGSAP